MKKASAAAAWVLLPAACILLNAAGMRRVFAGAIAGAADKNPLIEALGETKASLGDMLYLKSDAYFHGGLDERSIEHAHEGGTGEEHEAGKKPPALSGWSGWIYRGTRVVEHRHLAESEARELLPLLYSASKLDPENPEIALAAAYWIGRETGKPAAAAAALEDAFAHGARGWEMSFELGNVYSKMGDPVRAANAYARAQWALTAGVEPSKQVLLAYEFGKALEASGRHSEALTQYQKALSFYPPGQHTALRAELEKKISQLQY